MLLVYDTIKKKNKYKKKNPPKSPTTDSCSLHSIFTIS